MNLAHRWLGTYTSKVHSYIALADFSKAVMVRAGFPEHRIFVKPNFTLASAEGCDSRKSQIVFVGDISRHKGIHLLLAAWANTPPNGTQLVLIGDGPDKDVLQRQYAADERICWLGAQPHAEVMREIATSRFLVLPSLCYENCPMAVLEAFSVGTPVIVPEHGAFLSIMTGDEQGLLFEAGSERALVHAIRAATASGNTKWTRWSRNAVSRHAAQFSASRSYLQLMDIYRNTMEYCRALRKGQV